eukprot:gene67894-93024_t
MILIGGNGDNVYARLTEAMGRPDLKTHPKFVDHASRGVNQAELDQIISEWTSGYGLSDLHQSREPLSRHRRSRPCHCRLQ